MFEFDQPYKQTISGVPDRTINNTTMSSLIWSNATRLTTEEKTLFGKLFKAADKDEIEVITGERALEFF